MAPRKKVSQGLSFSSSFIARTTTRRARRDLLDRRLDHREIGPTQ
jgi:pyrroloquinoline quinone (PQQ) biosynthesis protein C